MFSSLNEHEIPELVRERNCQAIHCLPPSLRGCADLEGAKITLNEYLDRWLETAVKPRVREKTYQDYDAMLRRHIRPSVGERAMEQKPALVWFDSRLRFKPIL